MNQPRKGRKIIAQQVAEGGVLGKVGKPGGPVGRQIFSRTHVRSQGPGVKINELE